MAVERQPLSLGQRVRYVAYAVATAACFLVILDGVITWAEGAGYLDIGRPDDRVSTLSGDPWTRDGDRFVVTAAARRMMADESFAVEKGDRWRAFLLGGSFLKGVPYVGAGTIQFWLDRALRGTFPEAEIELVNAAATSQNSHRVRALVEYASDHEPDVLIIATCNNEGALPPAELTRRLQKSGTFRAFRKVLRPETPLSERPLHTPQDPDIDAVRAAYRENLTEMVRIGQAAGATVYLSTLPVNLRYAGDSPGRPTSLDGTTDIPSDVSRAPCVVAGHAAHTRGDHQGAIRVLSACDDVEALRWIGLSLYAQGRFEHARRALEQYLEVMPRNRCRPSFQRVIREVAAAEGVPLIDLEAAVKAVAPHGIPGPEHFVSYCHMSWRGQALVADTMLDALRAHGSRPPGPAVAAPAEDRAALFERHRRPLTSPAH